MKLLVFALLIVIPVVMAGLSPDMEYIFRNLMNKQSEDDHSGENEGDGDQGDMSGGMSGDIDEMLKMMMKMGHEDDEDKKDDHHDDDDDEYNMGKGRGWYDHDENDDRSDENDSDEKNDEKEEYEKFKKWMEEQEEEERHDKKEEQMRKKIMEFKKFKQMQRDKERQREEHKMALYKQMKMIKEKKMMSQHLHEVSMDFMNRKKIFTFDVMTSFLGLCDCHDAMDLFKRIKEGRFGYDDNDDDNRGDDMGDGDMPRRNGTSSGGSDGGMGEMEAYKKPSPEEMHEFVKRFLYMSHEERLKHVVHDVVQVMCGAAKQFFYHMKQVEHYLIEYRKHYY